MNKTPSQDQPDFSLIHTTLKQACEDYPGGIRELSRTIGKAPHTLANEINPSMPTHKLGLFDAITLLSLIKDPLPLMAIASVLDHTIIPLRDFSHTSDTELMSAYTQWHAEIGDVARELATALENERIGLEEYQRILREGLAQVQKFFAFMARLESLIDD